MDGLPAKGHKPAPGLTMADILALPDSQRQLITWMQRQTDCTLNEVVAHINQDEGVVQTLLDELVEKGFVQEMMEEGSLHYRVRLAPKRGSKIPSKLDQALDSNPVE